MKVVAPQRPQPLTVVKLPDEIDVTNASQVRDTLVRALNGSMAMPVLVADGTATTFCDCAGMSALIRAHHQAAAAGAWLVIATSPAISRILKLTGTEQALHTRSTVADSLRDLRDPAMALAAVAAPIPAAYEGNGDGSVPSQCQARAATDGQLLQRGGAEPAVRCS